jgi:hypothetical protein
MEVASPAAEIDSGDDNFAISGFNELAYLVQNFIQL